MTGRVAAVAAALVMSACVQDVRLEPRAADPAARPGGALRVAITAPAAVDPALVDATDVGARTIVRTMCDTLVQLDPVTGNTVPGLAESWTVTDAGRRLTLRLREGLRFSDGTALTSDDVAHSLFRMASEEVAAPAADILRPVVGFAQARGESLDGGLPATELAGVTTIDQRSLEIRLDRHMADFVRVLSHPATSPVPKARVLRDPSGGAASPVCVGPYRLARPWSPEASSIELVRSDAYHARIAAYSAGGGGYAQRIEFSVHRSRAAGIAAFRRGRADVARLSEDDLPRAALLGAPVLSGTAPTLEYIGLPVRRAPFDARAVRIALSQALDRRRISRVVYDGGRQPASGVVPPAAGEEMWRDGACGDHVPMTGDVAAARATLAEAGIDLQGRSFPLYVNDEFRNTALAAELARQWRAAFGVDVAIRAMSWERYLDAAGGQGGFDGPFRMAHSPQVPSAEAYLGPLLESSEIGRTNLTGFASRAFDRGIDREARRAAEAIDRREAYRALEDLACEQLPLIPVVVGGAHHVIRSDKVGSAVGALPIDRVSGDLLLRELYVVGAAG